MVADGNYIELDFTDAPPSQEPQYQRIPEGTYVMTVTKLDKTEAKSSGRPMIQATFAVAGGVHSGKRIGDNFVLPKDAGDNKVGLQRFNALIVAIGGKAQTKRARINLDSMLKKQLLIEVGDNTIPANGQYPERTVSKPIVFHNLKSASAEVKQAAASDKPAPAKPTPNGAGETLDDVLAETDVSGVELPEDDGAEVAAVQADAEVAAGVAATGDDVSSEDLDDLFASD